MHKDLVSEPRSSFLSCEKDIEIILKKLFIDKKVWGDQLKRLLVLNTQDCLDKDSELYDFYQNKIDKISLADLKQDGYIKLIPKIEMPEHEEIKSYIIISLDNFTTNMTNPEFRDCTVNFDIICHTDYWDIGNYRLRPIKIAGYIDGMLNKAKLTGIGEFNFLGCNQLILDEHLSGYTLSYRAIHGGDDLVPSKED